MKFVSFEAIVEQLYKHAIPVPKSECSKPVQLGVSFAGGYLAGILCAIVSHPADNLVSFLNNAKGATVGDVSVLIHWFVCFFIINSLLPLGFIKKKLKQPWLISLSSFILIGGEAARGNGSTHSWTSSSYCHDWNSDWGPVGYLWCLQSFRWPVSILTPLMFLQNLTSHACPYRHVWALGECV